MKIKWKSGKETTIYSKMPKGYEQIKGTKTQPVGTVWIHK